MSTVTLSQPHWAMVSAEKPLGMASHPLTQALPACRRFFSMFDISAFPRSRCGAPVLATPRRSRYAVGFRVRQLCDWHGRTLDFEGAVFREDMVILKGGRLAVELAPQSGGSV